MGVLLEKRVPEYNILKHLHLGQSKRFTRQNVSEAWTKSVRHGIFLRAAGGM